MSTLTPGNNPYALFTGLDGRPLNGGKVYIGVAGQDPETNPQPIFWDDQGAIAANNPMSTQAGYIWNNGGPARFWTQENTYSIRVRDRLGQQVLYEKSVSFALTAGEIPTDPAEQKAILEALAPGLGDPATAGLIGYVRLGENAVPRDLLDRGRDKTHVKDSGVEGSAVYGTGPDESAELLAALADAKARNIGSLDFDGGVFINVSEIIDIKGSYNNGRGFFINGNGATLLRTAVGDGVVVGDPLEPSHEYGMRVHIKGLNLTQHENAARTGAGFLINEAANIRFYDAWLQGWRFGAYFQGGLLSSIYRTELRQCDWGYYGGVKGQFAPNQNLLFDCRFTHNKRAIYQSAFSYGTYTLLACQVEGNNDGGTATDGVAVTDFQDAGHVNIAFSHLEGNPGQWSLRYNSPENRGLLAIGSEMIQTGDTGIEITAGRFTGISSRMTSSASTKDLNFAGPNATGVLIQCETRPSGYLGGLVSLRDGRIAFGDNPTLGSPLILAGSAAITAAANVASRWANDSVFEQFYNTAGAQTGYRYWQSGSAFGEVSIANIPRRTTIDGVVALEATKTTLGPGVDNAVSGGAPSKRYTQIYAAAGSINTSDERLKEWRGPLTEAELAAAREICASIGVYQWLDAIAAKGDDAARWHVGVKAQALAEIFRAHGLDPSRYGLYCYDLWEAEEAEYAPGERITISEGKAAVYSTPETPGDEPVLLEPAVEPVYEYGEPTLIKPAREAGDLYGVRADELLFFLMAAQEQRLAALEAALASQAA